VSAVSQILSAVNQILSAVNQILSAVNQILSAVNQILSAVNQIYLCKILIFHLFSASLHSTPEEAALARLCDFYVLGV